MKAAGLWLVLASASFWLAWALMPGVGVTDTDTIFRLVAQHRARVLASTVLQLASAAALAPAIVTLAGGDAARGARLLRAGTVLLALGALGSVADAIFHLVAFEMTRPGVDLAAMAPVMRRLQGPDLALLLPFVLALFVAHALVTAAFRRRDALARAGSYLVLLVPAVGTLGAMLLPHRLAGLATLAALSGGLALTGISLARRPA